MLRNIIEMRSGWHLVGLAGVVILAALLAGTSLYAVCAQNSDVIHLKTNGKKVTNSNYVLVSKNKDRYSIASYCLEGTCFSRFYGGDVSNVYFVQITDEDLQKKIKEVFSETERSVVEGNKGLEQERYKGTRNLYVSDRLSVSSPLNNLIIENIDGFKKYPFLKINSVKNNFSYDYCSYARVITYDLVTKQISVEDNKKNPSSEIKKPSPITSGGNQRDESE